MASEIQNATCQYCAVPFSIEKLIVNEVTVAQRHAEPVCSRYAVMRDKAERFNAAALEAAREHVGFTLFIGAVNR